jgi:adenosyl cobinamide kinase/adenosyl cobinamide phosphate guanylyltransferase
MNIVKLKKPKITPPEMLCDRPLHPKLNNYELTSYLNHHSTNLLLGKPRSGKSSLMWAMLKDKKLLNRVYHNIYLFQPSHSRASIKNDIFKKHPSDKKFDELTFENLQEVMERIKGTPPDENNVIIFDDMASYLKNKDTLQLFKELIFNRRHIRTSIFFLNQTFFSVPKELRRLFSNIFVFKVSKNELKNLFEEVVEDEYVKSMMPSISKLVYDRPFSYLFINTDNQKFYKQFDRIDFNED